MNDTPTLGQKVRYRIDRFLSHSHLNRLLGLFLASAAIVLLTTALASILRPGAEDLAPSEAFWWALTRVLDPGTMAEDAGWMVRAVALSATLLGIFVVALLIGLISSTVSDTFESLRKGGSPVIDSGHTLILGFGEKVFTILRELREANRSRSRDATIVILSMSDKEEVETLVRERMGDLGNTRVVVRQGSPFSPNDLRKVGAGRARSIIVMGSDADPDDDAIAHQADLGAIKTLLALRRVPGALQRNHAVVELLDEKRRSVVERLGGAGVEIVAMRETLGRMMVQTARQRGLAQIYEDLLSYDGRELYFHRFPSLAGLRWGEAQARVKDAAVLGTRHVGADGRIEILVNPPAETILAATDELLVLAEDDDSFSEVAPRALPPARTLSPPPPLHREPERILICGYNGGLPAVLREFDHYVLSGTQVVLMPGVPKSQLPWLAGEGLPLVNLSIEYSEGDPTQPEALKAIAERPFHVAMMMADDTRDPQEADARTVITLLLLRELFEAHARPPRLISEILDPSTKELVSIDDAGDFVVSSEITSMLLAQVSERRELNAVFRDLFAAEGNEVYLKRFELYAPADEALTWLELQRAARDRHEVAIGLLPASGSPQLNPAQEARISFAPGDRLIVIAEDEAEDVSTAQLARSA